MSGPRVAFEGFVLAGGASKRFGSDKALAVYRGRTLLEHALAAVEGTGAFPRVVTREIEPYRPYARAFITSERPNLGPVEGLRAALRACSKPWALVVGTDMPGVTGAVLRRLLAAGAERGGAAPALPQADAEVSGTPDGKETTSAGPGEAGARGTVLSVCFGEANGRRHPLPGLYARSLLPRLEGITSLHGVLDLGARILGEDDGVEDLAAVLRNVNRSEDLARE